MTGSRFQGGPVGKSPQAITPVESSRHDAGTTNYCLFDVAGSYLMKKEVYVILNIRKIPADYMPRQRAWAAKLPTRQGVA